MLWCLCSVPKLTVTDITDIYENDTAALIEDELRGVDGICGSPRWWHKHPLALPYGVVPKGVLSCLEQAPKAQYSFLVATGRKYLLAFYDRYDVFVAGAGDIAMFKMLPSEHVLFTMSMKAPFERERLLRVISRPIAPV